MNMSIFNAEFWEGTFSRPTSAGTPQCTWTVPSKISLPNGATSNFDTQPISFNHKMRAQKVNSVEGFNHPAHTCSSTKNPEFNVSNTRIWAHWCPMFDPLPSTSGLLAQRWNGEAGERNKNVCWNGHHFQKVNQLERQWVSALTLRKALEETVWFLWRSKRCHQFCSLRKREARTSLVRIRCLPCLWGV